MNSTPVCEQTTMAVRSDEGAGTGGQGRRQRRRSFILSMEPQPLPSPIGSGSFMSPVMESRARCAEARPASSVHALVRTGGRGGAVGRDRIELHVTVDVEN